MPMGVCYAQDVEVTEDDLKNVRELFTATTVSDPKTGKVKIPGLRVLKTPAAFPNIYTHDPGDKTKQFVHEDGRDYRPIIVGPRGERESDNTRKYKRGVERWFVGSDRWPDGLPLGMTYIETKDAASSAKYTFTGAVADVSHEQIEQLKTLAAGDKWYSVEEKTAIANKKEKLRAQAAENALDPDAQMTRVAASAAAAALGAMRNEQKAATPAVPAK